jgi:hypothetical protein
LIALLYCFYPKDLREESAVSTAEDDVYEAVVRDMTSTGQARADLKQLVFDETVLNGHLGGDAAKACKESVLKQRQWVDKPPYNSVADKIYRALTGGSYDAFPQADTIQDFAQKSCSGDSLSRTFHTDSPRVFVDPDAFFMDVVPIRKNTLRDFQQTFPEAAGIISLSRVGFDSRLDEAIVSTSFVCGGLCGSGRLYILRKKQGRWQVIGNSTVWIS